MKFKMNTEEDLNKLSKEELVKLNLEMQEQMVSTWERLMANNHKKFLKVMNKSILINYLCLMKLKQQLS